MMSLDNHDDETGYQGTNLLCCHPRHTEDEIPTDEDELRQCRICLDDELEHGSGGDLIAPCSCTGHQKWVHRTCLDEWRANNTDHAAFSKCNECLTDYRMVYVGPSAGRREYCCYVTRDVGIGFTLLQSLMLVLGALVWLCFAQNEDSGFKTMAGITIRNTWLQLLLADLITGLVIVLMMLGLYGAVALSMSKCSLDRTMEKLESLADTLQGPRRPATAPRSGPVGGFDNDVEASINRASRTPTHQPMARSGRQDDRYYDRESECCGSVNCDCCNGVYCCCQGCPVGSVDCDCKGDNPALLVILFIVGVVLAAIGLFVGVFLSCHLLRGIMERHMFRLEKKRLTQNYVVQDLSVDQDPNVATELPPPIAAPSDDIAEDIPTKGCSIPQKDQCKETPHKDYLRELGLMEPLLS